MCCNFLIKNFFILLIEWYHTAQKMKLSSKDFSDFSYPILESAKVQISHFTPVLLKNVLFEKRGFLGKKNEATICYNILIFQRPAKILGKTWKKIRGKIL